MNSLHSIRPFLLRLFLCAGGGLALLNVNASYANSSCSVIFSSPSIEEKIPFYDKQAQGVPFVKGYRGRTNNLIAYLQEILEGLAIEDRERKVESFLRGLENKKVLNFIDERDKPIDKSAFIHYDEIQNYIDKGGLNQDVLKEWAEGYLSESQRIHVKREEAREKTLVAYQKMEFHRVNAGAFYMGNEKNKQRVKLTNPIEVMATPVTQAQWVEVMRENPSHFVKGDDSIVVSFNGKLVRMQPDNPVESITWWSALVFANRLSEAHGLPPVYDLSEVDEMPNTRVADGTLNVQRRGSRSIKINVSHGDYYQAKGYRLPTRAEQEYILRTEGRVNERYHFGYSEADLKDYAWYRENSDMETHPVGQLKPMIINGKEFHDLIGNVAEMGWDFVVPESKPLNDWLSGFLNFFSVQVNPMGRKSGFYHVISGGSFFNLPRALQSHYPLYYDPEDVKNDIGFRLVRTINE